MNTTRTARSAGPIILAGVIGLAAGCQRHLAQAAGPAPSTPGAAVTSTPAPFSSPPVLAGAPDIATLVARVSPAVVNITTVHEQRGTPLDEMPFGFDPFGMFPQLGRRGRRPGGDTVRRQQALGSGFIVDPRGYVVTNAHVVEEADSVRVKLLDEREFEAKVKGRDTRLDLAVLELVGASNLPSTSLGSSDQLRVGEYVVAIGNPFGLGHTVTMGIVSAKSRSIGAGPYDDFIQTDASINPGNSGGPLFDLRGQVIGINTAINPNGRGIGFAIPVNALKDVLPQLLTTGKVARGRLGVGIQPVDAALAKALGLDRPRGALVGDVEPGGPAEHAGLRAGDVITRVDQVEIAHAEELPRVVARHPPGSKVRIEYLRERGSRSADVTLDALRDPEGANDVAGSQGSGAPEGSSRLGVEITDLPGQGAVVGRVAGDGPAAGELAPGDLILEVNRTPVKSAADVAKQVAAVPARQPVLLKVKRGEQTRFVAIERR
jgi:serine protease Do